MRLNFVDLYAEHYNAMRAISFKSHVIYLCHTLLIGEIIHGRLACPRSHLSLNDILAYEKIAEEI